MERSSESRAQSQYIHTWPLPSRPPCEIHAELNFRCCQAGVPSSHPQLSVLLELGMVLRVESPCLASL